MDKITSPDVVEKNNIEEKTRVAIQNLKDTAERIRSKLGNSSNLDNNPEKKAETVSWVKQGLNFIKSHLPEILIAAGVAFEVAGIKTVDYDPASVDRMILNLNTGLGIAEGVAGLVTFAGAFALWTENSLNEAKARKLQKSRI